MVHAMIDAFSWAPALAFATIARYDLDIDLVDFRRLRTAVFLAAVCQIVVGLASGLYRGRWRFGSFDEVAAVAQAALVTSGVLFVLNRWLVYPVLVPSSATLAGGVAALMLMTAVRYGWRLALERRLRPSGHGCSRLLVFGAGSGALQVIPAMLRDPQSPYLPVGLLDDDPSKRNLRIMGVPVLGGRDRLGEAAASTDAGALLIAMPSADAELVSELSESAREAGLDVKVLPSLSELFGEGVNVTDIRDLTPADFLGRHQVETDIESAAEYLNNKRVLVTGAGGSIGSELCRQISRVGPAELIMLDHDESALHAVQLSIEGRALLDSHDLALVDIRDRRTVGQFFTDRRPHVVFHAAALKHLPLLERHPEEAIKTNVVATLNLLQLAAETGVERFVNISTDKAADPVSVLGYTKRISERLTAYMSRHADGTYLSVRFGNVLGSRGSMLETFQKQIAGGGPVTVTHPEVTRYFMTVQEAIQLVIQAGAIGREGEALVLSMGSPVRIADVANTLITQSDCAIPVVFTGLRPGEKLHEVLFNEDEEDKRPVHPLISHVDVPPLKPEMIAEPPLLADSDALKEWLRELALRAVPFSVVSADRAEERRSGTGTTSPF